ncbi:hypothetical protein HYW74_00935 [Candidatus Pacearchaeota archaeon]|nr:hypothetical protein [Candidatus Pacearchaeota archaeon]
MEEQESDKDIDVSRVVCPKPAYDRLNKSGLIRLIKSKKRQITDLLLLGDFEGKIGNLLNQARTNFLKNNKKITERSEMFRDIVEFDLGLDEENFGALSNMREELTLKHPSLLAYLLLGEKVFDFEKFGFPTRISLEKSIASFCIGEKLWSFGDREWVWRRGDFRYEISQNVHGDLYAGQIDASGRDYTEKTLLGDWNIFDTLKLNIRDFQGIFAYQDWSQFLVASLKYAEAIGKSKMPEIIQWKKVLEQVGAVGTHTAECMFGEGGGDFSTEILFDNDIIMEGKKSKKFPACVYGDGNNHYIPYIKNGNICYLFKDKEGEIELEGHGRFFENGRYKIVLEYAPEDLPDVLKATYRFFARDRSMLPKIMNKFIKETSK